MFETASKLIEAIGGVVKTVEQKSGLNSILFIIAMVTTPSLFLYGFNGRMFFAVIALLPLLFFAIIYVLAFFIDRNFLRSEKHVEEVYRINAGLGDSDKQLSEADLIDLPSEVASKANRSKMVGQRKKKASNG